MRVFGFTVGVGPGVDAAKVTLLAAPPVTTTVPRFVKAWDGWPETFADKLPGAYVPFAMTRLHATSVRLGPSRGVPGRSPRLSSPAPSTSWRLKAL